MGPSFKSFVDQLVLVKLSSERPDTINPFYKRLAKNSLAFSAGAGLGSAGAVALSDKLLPKILPRLTPQQRSLLMAGATLLSGTATGLTGLAVAKSLRQADMEEAEWKRKKELEKR
jgi:hypothetical protein